MTDDLLLTFSSVSAFDPVTNFALRSQENPLRLDQLWAKLVDGRARVVDAPAWRANGILVLQLLEVSRPAIKPRCVEVLERLLSGDSQKACAHDTGLSVSMITAMAKQGLSEMGVHCVPSRVPLLLAVLVSSARHQRAFPSARIIQVCRDGVTHCIVSVPPPTLLFENVLPEAERAVAALLLEGVQYREIAARRRTSVRTVANQVAAVFHRLNLSGRSELLACAARSLSSPLSPQPRASGGNQGCPVSQSM
ncbi:MAG: helix-turn-helix transcriptional regulator [Myxococcota bacterium]